MSAEWVERLFIIESHISFSALGTLFLPDLITPLSVPSGWWLPSGSLDTLSVDIDN